MPRLAERWFETIIYLLTAVATLLLILHATPPQREDLVIAFVAFTSGLAAARLAPHVLDWLVSWRGREK